MAPLILKADQSGINRASERLRAGGLVAFATETVYGLGADATNPKAVATIYATKGRPTFNPLIAHVASRQEADKLVDLPPALARLADAFWPGPLTLVAPKRAHSHIADLMTAGLPTLAVRVPGNAVARALICAAGCPVAAPSANLSGRVSPTTAEHVAADFAGSDLAILDAGPCVAGLESTIVGIDAAGRLQLLRPGAIAKEDIERVAGEPLQQHLPPSNAAPTAPGQLTSHYAPQAKLRLFATGLLPGEHLIAFGCVPPPLQRQCEAQGADVLNLSPSGDLSEAAANLFAVLRRVDQRGWEKVAVMPVPSHGLGLAIADRLNRAAAPRG